MILVFHVPTCTSVLLVMGVSVLYLWAICIYRAFFHPIAKFPGPILARVSRLYYFKWNVLNRGQLIFHMPELFEKYGPIVRLGPNGLAIRDIDHYHEVFKMGTKFAKDPASYCQPVLAGSLIALTSIPEARARREAILPFFSKPAVKTLEPLIHNKVRLFMKRVEEFALAGKPLDATRGYKALTADIITEYCGLQFPRSLEAEDFQPMFLGAFQRATKMVHFNKYFPSFMKILMITFHCLPESILRIVLPGFHDIMQWMKKGRDQVFILKADSDLHNPANRNVLQNLLNHDPKTGRKPLPDRMIAVEAILLVVAGTDTTGHALTVATYNLLRNPQAEARILEELRSVMPGLHDECSVSDLESLPYFGAVLKESLRHSYGVPGFLPRVVPPSGTYVKDQFIPGGTAIFHSNYIYHNDPVVFGPDPHVWRPERWLEASKPKLAQMEKHFMPFSRGSRICVGMNLAWAELHIVLGIVFRRFQFQLFETTEEDMKWSDTFVPTTKGALRLVASRRRN